MKYVTIAFLTVLAAVNSAHAATLYSFTAPNFSAVLRDDEPPSGTYTTDMAISGWFLTDSLLTDLGSSARGGAVDITGMVDAFSFSDGRSVLTSGDSFERLTMAMATDSAGNPIQWQFRLDSQVGTPGDGLYSQMFIRHLYTGFVFDSSGFGFLEACNLPDETCVDFGETRTIDQANYYGAGTWTISAAVPLPLPAGMLGLALATLGAGGAIRRRRGTSAPD